MGLTALGEMGPLEKLRREKQPSEHRAPALYHGGPPEEAEPAQETRQEELDKKDETSGQGEVTK